MGVLSVFLVAALLAPGWEPLPEVRAQGFSGAEAVRVGRSAVIVAGASHRADRVYAIGTDGSAPVAAPLRWRAGQSVVAAGQDALVWGGASNTGELADGGAYRPATRRWRMLPRSPLRPRAFHSAVWTGFEMLVWGGRGERGPLSDGAAYRPRRRSSSAPRGGHDGRSSVGRWRRLARSPLRPRRGHVAVWTGRAMLVWGGRLDRGIDDGGRLARDGARYVPRSDRWRRMAPAPLRATEDTTAVWTGRRMLVWTGKAGAEYDPGENRWARLPPAPIEPRRAFTAVWAGRRLLIWGGEGKRLLADGAAYDPATRTWTLLPDSPLRPRAGHAAVATREGMVVWGGCCDDGAVYRPGAVVTRRRVTTAARHATTSARRAGSSGRSAPSCTPPPGRPGARAGASRAR